MAVSQTFATDAGTLHLRMTTAVDGDFSLSCDADELAERRRMVVGSPWTWLRQVHGDVVHWVEWPGHEAGMVGDGAATNCRKAPISVLTADCAPVALVGTTGFAIVHAGWKGAQAGVIGRAADLLRNVGSKPVATVLGPCIHPLAYEFGVAELESLEQVFGPRIRGLSSTGSAALDMPALVESACNLADWPAPDHRLVIDGSDMCTSSSSYFSHRTRADLARQAMVGWLE